METIALKTRAAAEAMGAPATSSISCELQIPAYVAEVLKACLFSVYMGKAELQKLSVVRMVGLHEDGKPEPIGTTAELGHPDFELTNKCVSATIQWNGDLYEVTVTEKDEGFRVVRRFHCLAISALAKQPTKLVEFLIIESLRASGYHGAFLEVAQDKKSSSEGPTLRIMPDIGDRLCDVFLSEANQRYIQLFIHVLSNYAKVQKGIRYLFAGPAGMGKTKCLRAIANECRGKATFIFSNGQDTLEDLLGFAQLFTPSVVCIDDLDLIAGPREDPLRSTALQRLLQELDGFQSHPNLFLLATTNDLALVDGAASRPGRFDALIRIGDMQPHQYGLLIRSKTSDQRILDLLVSRVMDSLVKRKVTGAFVSNLIRHLELMISFDPECVDDKYVRTVVEELFEGFSKNSRGCNEKVGF